jgi:hypothetical protein
MGISETETFFCAFCLSRETVWTRVMPAQTSAPEDAWLEVPPPPAA